MFSREDRINVDAILSQMPKYTPFEEMRQKKVFRILDIGSGNGAKAIYLAKCLARQGFWVKVDSIEPKKEQREHLFVNYLNEPHFMGQVFDSISGESGAPRTRLS